MTATLDELKDALIETLEHRGVLGQVKAKVRAEIFATLNDEQVPPPELPRENAVINELIREYLEYNGYHHTLSVLLPESGHPRERQFSRSNLAEELQLQEDNRSKALPLIYTFTRSLRSRTELPQPITEHVSSGSACRGGSLQQEALSAPPSMMRPGGALPHEDPSPPPPPAGFSAPNNAPQPQQHGPARPNISPPWVGPAISGIPFHEASALSGTFIDPKSATPTPAHAFHAPRSLMGTGLALFPWIVVVAASQLVTLVIQNPIRGTGLEELPDRRDGSGME